MVANRTMTRRTQHHPVFAERYPFNIQENLLDQITIVITVINKKATGKNDRNIGWISFGKFILKKNIRIFIYVCRTWCQW